MPAMSPVGAKSPRATRAIADTTSGVMIEAKPTHTHERGRRTTRTRLGEPSSVAANRDGDGCVRIALPSTDHASRPRQEVFAVLLREHKPHIRTGRLVVS